MVHFLSQSLPSFFLAFFLPFSSLVQVRALPVPSTSSTSLSCSGARGRPLELRSCGAGRSVGRERTRKAEPGQAGASVVPRLVMDFPGSNPGCLCRERPPC